VNDSMQAIMKRAGDPSVGHAARRLAGLAVAVHQYETAKLFRDGHTGQMLAGEGLARMTVVSTTPSAGVDANRTEVIR